MVGSLFIAMEKHILFFLPYLTDLEWNQTKIIDSFASF